MEIISMLKLFSGLVNFHVSSLSAECWEDAIRKWDPQQTLLCLRTGDL